MKNKDRKKYWTCRHFQEIQEFRQRANQPTTLSSIVEDAIGLYYDRLVDEGAIPEEQ